jgi:carbonic anhydrase
MRLFDAIIEANHRAGRGDKNASIHLNQFAEALPVVALTCIDTRLNRLFPDVLGLPEERFIWLRNAGNIITSPMSSTMRSLALACAVKHGREIAVIGHSDCRIRSSSINDLIDLFKAQGISRAQLPDNLTDFFGVFASEQQNVIRAVDFIRSSPLIGPAIPVHGLMVDTTSGYLNWVVNGYEMLERVATRPVPGVKASTIGGPLESMDSIGHFNTASMTLPQTQIGEIVSTPKPSASTAEPPAMPGSPPVLPKPSLQRPKAPIIISPNIKLW